MGKYRAIGSNKNNNMSVFVNTCTSVAFAGNYRYLEDFFVGTDSEHTSYHRNAIIHVSDKGSFVSVKGKRYYVNLKGITRLHY